MAYGYEEAPLPPMSENMRLATEDMFDHLGPESFEQYTDDVYLRDTNIAKLTGGMVGVKVFRSRPEGPRVGVPWHWHELGVQISYVTRGWAVCEFEGVGQVRLEAGTVWYQPPFNRQRELEWSEDYEAIEFTLPGEFKSTIMLPKDGKWQYIDLTIGDKDEARAAEEQAGQ